MEKEILHQQVHHKDMMEAAEFLVMELEAEAVLLKLVIPVLPDTVEKELKMQ